MLQFDLAPQEISRVLVQEEPELELAIPQIFDQPELTTLQRGRLPNVEAWVAKLYGAFQAHPERGLGPDYQELVIDFRPLFDWAIASWDYLLSTEGCRFIPRNGEHKPNSIRGDYRAVTDTDYSRLVHGVFRSCVLSFAQQPDAPSLPQWIRGRFWPLVRDTYCRLETPPDPNQRILTPYSYLRCIPYQFLNDFHHELVWNTVGALPDRQRAAITTYFGHFCTEAATATILTCSVPECLDLLRKGLTRLLIKDRLVYCLLRQIERY